MTQKVGSEFTINTGDMDPLNLKKSLGVSAGIVDSGSQKQTADRANAANPSFNEAVRPDGKEAPKTDANAGKPAVDQNGKPVTEQATKTASSQQYSNYVDAGQNAKGLQQLVQSGASGAAVASKPENQGAQGQEAGGQNPGGNLVASNNTAAGVAKQAAAPTVVQQNIVIAARIATPDAKPAALTERNPLEMLKALRAGDNNQPATDKAVAQVAKAQTGDVSTNVTTLAGQAAVQVPKEKSTQQKAGFADNKDGEEKTEKSDKKAQSASTQGARAQKKLEDLAQGGTGSGTTSGGDSDADGATFDIATASRIDIEHKEGASEKLGLTFFGGEDGAVKTISKEFANVEQTMQSGEKLPINDLVENWKEGSITERTVSSFLAATKNDIELAKQFIATAQTDGRKDVSGYGWFV